MLNKLVPLLEATLNKSSEDPLVPCKVKRDVGVADPIPTLERAVIFNMEVPLEEAALKISLVPEVPWILNPIVELVAFIPITVPLSISLPTPIAEADVQMTVWPMVPPDNAACLPLKVDQSVAESWPVLLAEAVGRFMVMEFVVVETLKIVPVVPVAMARRESTLL